MFKLPLQVTCPYCGNTKTLSAQRVSAEKFVAELCDGRYGARHKVTEMVGPKGKTNA